MDGLGPLSRWRFTLEGTWHLTRELADIIGVHTSTVRDRCITTGLVPARIETYGGHDVWLFTPEEADAVFAEFNANPPRPGRPRIYSPTEAAERSRARRRAHYWQARVELARHRGDREEETRAQANLDGQLRLLSGESPQR